MPSAVLIRASLICLISSSILLSYEIIYHKFYNRRGIPLWLGIVVAISTVFFFVSTGYIGALLAVCMSPAADRQSYWVWGIGLVGGLWVFSILIQFAQNGIRMLVGAPTRPIRWINSRGIHKKHKLNKGKP